MVGGVWWLVFSFPLLKPRTQLNPPHSLLHTLSVDVIQLASLKAVAKKFTDLENYQTEEEFDNNFIFKIFAFDWLAMYFWFFALAFLYVPFGQWWTTWIGEHFGEYWTYDYKRDTFGAHTHAHTLSLTPCCCCGVVIRVAWVAAVSI